MRTALGNDRSSLLENTTTVSIEEASIGIGDDHVVRGVEPDVLVVERLARDRKDTVKIHR